MIVKPPFLQKLNHKSREKQKLKIGSQEAEAGSRKPEAGRATA